MTIDIYTLFCFIPEKCTNLMWIVYSSMSLYECMDHTYYIIYMGVYASCNLTGTQNKTKTSTRFCTVQNDYVMMIMLIPSMVLYKYIYHSHSIVERVYQWAMLSALN